MARVDMVTCDQCKKSIERGVAMGWIHTEHVVSIICWTMEDRSFDADFCGPLCLVAYFAPVPQEAKRR